MPTTRLLTAVLLLGVAATTAMAAPAVRRPNVVLIMTDDQGHGDLGVHGNPILRTPHLDAFSRQSVDMVQFYVSPVCAPTRASLMTGRYNYRTGVVDTYRGRAMMYSEEVTLAEMLAEAGYRTGIFGKWHLGDNYPLRPTDQGFSEALVHRGGGVGQPADPPGNTYFDAVLQHNDKTVKSKGYCSDVFTDGAIDFIDAHQRDPFFVYLAYNCPHTPLQVADRDYLPYKKKNLAHDQFPAVGYPLRGKADQDETARVYGMVSNIDDNLGRLFAKLDALKLTDDTIVIFLTDNGPQQERYKSGLRGRKATAFEGGIRVPCFIRWPVRLQPLSKVDRIAAHIDIAPTLLEACGVAKPTGVNFDGKSLMPLLTGQADEWPDRTLYFQSHRGDVPELYRNAAARSQRYKLVQTEGSFGKPMESDPVFELYDMLSDPFEQNNLANEYPDILAKLKQGYENWIRDVGGTRGYAPPRIHLGTPHENPVVLTRQDWRANGPGWGLTGHWEVQVAEAGTYDIMLRFATVEEAGATAHVTLTPATDDVQARETNAWDAGIPGACDRHTFRGVRLGPGPARLDAWIARGNESVGVHYVDVQRID